MCCSQLKRQIVFVRVECCQLYGFVASTQNTDFSVQLNTRTGFCLVVSFARLPSFSNLYYPFYKINFDVIACLCHSFGVCFCTRRATIRRFFFAYRTGKTSIFLDEHSFHSFADLTLSRDAIVLCKVFHVATPKCQFKSKVEYRADINVDGAKAVYIFMTKYSQVSGVAQSAKVRRKRQSFGSAVLHRFEHAFHLVAATVIIVIVIIVRKCFQSRRSFFRVVAQ